eukprot:1137785-Pelagomonas_calceolata.AAC.5
MHWPKRAVSPHRHKATKQRMLMGVWRVTGSTRLRNLAVRIDSVPSGNTLVGAHKRMGTQLQFTYIHI